MKTLTTLTLAATMAVLFPAAAAAGPERPIAPKTPGREIPALKVTPKCKSMALNRNEKFGGTIYVACTKAVRDTMACRLACR